MAYKCLTIIFKSYDEALKQIVANRFLPNRAVDGKRSEPEFQPYSPWSQIGVEAADRAAICGGRNFHGSYILTLLCNSFRSTQDETSAHYNEDHGEEDRENHPKYTLSME